MAYKVISAFDIYSLTVYVKLYSWTI